jgi:hypothetical protein
MRFAVPTAGQESLICLRDVNFFRVLPSPNAENDASAGTLEESFLT